MIPAPHTFATKTEESLWLDAKRAEQTAGLVLDPGRGRISLEEYALAWLESHSGIAPRTREIYESQIRLHIVPLVDDRVAALGRTALCDLTPELVRAWHRALSARRGATTAAKCYVRLRQILRQAVDDDPHREEPVPDAESRGRGPRRAALRNHA